MSDINIKRSYSEVLVGGTPTSTFNIGFEYTEKVDHINAKVDNQPANAAGYTYTITSPNTVTFSPVVPSGSLVRLERETNIDNNLHKFTAGAEFNAAHMDANFAQIRNSQQEVKDAFTELAERTYDTIDGLDEALATAQQNATDATLAQQAAAASASTAIASNAATINAVNASNAATVAAVSTSNASTVSSVNTSNTNTLNAVNAANAANLAAVNTAKSDAQTAANASATSAVNAQAAVTELQRFQLSITSLGAIGDGTLHPLSERYATLASAQLKYPHATALTDSIDWAALQLAINSLPYSPSATIDPKTAPNGGLIVIPRGKYILNKQIILKRGVRIDGASRESTQLWSLRPDGLLKYDDAGRYLPDEIVISNLSLWQDASVVPTSGAGIYMRSSGLVPEASISVKLDNLIIEGFYNNINIGDGINTQLNRVDQAKAIGSGCILDSQFFTTSSTFTACYAHSNGGSGWVFNKLYYVDLSGMASDSNTGYGFEFIDCRTINLRGGAEANTLKAVKIKNCYGTTLSIGSINNLTGAIDIDNSFFTVVIGSMLTGNTGTAIVGTNGSTWLQILNSDLENGYFANRVSGVARIVDSSTTTTMQTDGQHWQVGDSAALQVTSQWKYAGTVVGTESSIVDVQTTFLPTAAPSGQYNAQKLTWRGSTTGAFAAGVGSYITNGLISGGGTVARKIGEQIEKQTGGTSANASLFLADGVALPVGNWSLMNAQPLPSYFQDKIYFGSTVTTAPYLTSGTGVPSATAPNGSIYARTDGVTGSTLYIRVGAAWLPLTV